MPAYLCRIHLYANWVNILVFAHQNERKSHVPQVSGSVKWPRTSQSFDRREFQYSFLVWYGVSHLLEKQFVLQMVE